MVMTMGFIVNWYGERIAITGVTGGTSIPSIQARARDSSCMSVTKSRSRRYGRAMGLEE